MSNDPLKNWQLEKSEEPLDQWKLQDAEQAASHLQLQETGATPKNWQPVEYQRTPARSGRNWILPSVVIVALLAALAYVAYISLNNLGLTLPVGSGPAAAPTTAATPDDVAAALPAIETPTEEPTPTPDPPTPTPAPPPTPTPALILTRVGTVNDPAGVNARREPSTTAPIIRLLNNGERVTIVRQEGDWLLVILPENQAAWAWAEYFDQSVGEEKTLEEWNAMLTAAGLPPVTPIAEPAAAPTAESTTPLLTATVIADPGATLRIEPALQAQVVGEALLGTALTVSGRTAGSDWLLVTLADGRRGWIAAGLVAVEGDVATLPVQPADSLVGTVAVTPTVSAPEAPSAAPPFTLVTNDVIPPAPYTNTVPSVGAAIAISDTAGVRARTAPSLEAGIVTVLPNGAVLPAVGRSTDNQWVQVVLPDDQRAWVFRGVVNVSSNIDDVPIVGADGQALEPTPAPETPGEPTLTVRSLLGANIRPAPNNESEPIETVSMGATFPAIGRTEDGSWIQVRLADGTTGWVLASTSELNVDVATLPVVP